MRVETIKTYKIAKNGRVSLVEGRKTRPKAKDAKLSIKELTTLQMALNSPIWHRPVDLGIKEFKRFLKKIPMLSKAEFNRQVRAYKDKSWGEFDKMIKHKGTFPTRTI